MENNFIIKYILFDLDGTITDPFLGITRSVAYSLESFGIKVNGLEELKVFIGPPLRESYMNFYGMNEQQSEHAVNKYREYFSDKGIFENEVYLGIEDLLEELVDQGKKLYICTSKPVVFAKKILKHFDLEKYFTGVYGSELDGTRSAKKDVISYCLENENINKDSCIMVGDRKHDIIGANENNLPCIGVLYGYGSKDELEELYCDKIVSNIEELKNVLLKQNS